MISFILCLFTFMLFLFTTLSDSINTSNVDIPATLQLPGLQILKRVEKKVDIQHEYHLVDGHKWTPFPEMQINFDLPFSQYVKIKYLISFDSTATNSYIATQVYIDGVENREMRGHSVNTWCPTVFRYL